MDSEHQVVVRRLQRAIFEFARLVLIVGLYSGGCSTSPQLDLATPMDPSLWHDEFQEFRSVLENVTNTGKVVPLHELESRLKRGDTSVYAITDGRGGFVDLQPEPGTVQERVNRYFAGARVRWVMTLSEPPVQGILRTVHIYPAEPPTPRTKAQARCADILEIQVSADSLPDEANLKKGDTVMIEGLICDSNVSTDLRLSGVNAAYHYREGGKYRTVFLVRLDDARISASENSQVVPHKR